MLLVKGSKKALSVEYFNNATSQNRHSPLFCYELGLIRISHSPWLAFTQERTVYWLYFLLESIISHTRLKQQLLVAALKVIHTKPHENKGLWNFHTGGLS